MTSHHHAPAGQYQSRREHRLAVDALQRPSRSVPKNRAPKTPQRSTLSNPPPPRKVSLKATGAFVAIGLLLTTYMLPAYADSLPVADAAPNLPDTALQSMSVPEGLAREGASRDQYLVTRTTLAGYQPYEHLADTFANNPTSSLQWPFQVGVPISSWFGFRSCAGCSSDHQGIDFNPGEGTPIQAIADGVVTEVGNPNGSFGVYAMISHQVNGQNVSSLYAHMLQGSLALAVGDTVSKGQLVGQVGSTGQSTGPHLHFGLYLDGATAIDPYPWMKERVGS